MFVLAMLIGRQSGMAVRMSTPINQLFHDESIAVKTFCLMFIRELAMDSMEHMNNW